MSGITGWIDYARDLSRERSTVLAMTATMACRGPDGEEVWVSPQAVFGHRNLAVFDLANRTGAAGGRDGRHSGNRDDGRQPVAVEHDGQLLAVGMHSGSILNHAELAAELTGRGHRFRGGSHSEVLVRAYLEWGTDCVHKLDGSFAGAVWDARSRSLWLVRDRLGIEPLFYFPTPTGMLFGSEPKAILAHPMAEAVAGPDELREILTYSGTPEQAPFLGMHRLRAGRMLTVSERGRELSAYWNIEAVPHTDDLDTTIATIRGMLEESMERNLRSDVPVGSLLSGGLDSSAVTALADAALRPRGERVRTFTVDFERHANNFQPNDTRSAMDPPYSQDVVRHVNAEHTDVLLDPAELGDPVLRAAVLRAKDFPTALGDMNTSLHLLARAVGEHVRVVMTGEAADSLFHGVGWNRDPVEANMNTFPWVARGIVRDDANGLGCALFDEALLRDLNPLGYAAQRYSESVSEAPRLPDAGGVDQHMRELCWVHMTNFMENQNAHTERLFKAVGVEVRMPFCDHRLVQYAYNLPWDLQNFDGREKSLLRAAVKDLLPRSVVERLKSPYPVTVDPAYEKVLRDDLAALLDDPTAPVLPLLNRKAAQALLDDPTALGAWAKRANVELPLQINSWLRQYGIRLAL